MWSIVLVVGTVVAAVAIAHFSHTPWPQSLAAVFAVASLTATATAAYMAFARSRKKDTIDVWSQWSDKHWNTRIELSNLLGKHQISDEQAAGLIGTSKLFDKDGADISAQRGDLANKLSAMLNGLERLAVGVNLGVYDERVVRKLGGTGVIRIYDQFEPYIELRNTSRRKDLKQIKAFEQLGILVKTLHMSRLDAQSKNLRDTVDKERLTTLK